MRWQQGRRSSNVEDRRGSGGAKKAGLGIGGVLVALVAIFVFGADPKAVLQGLQGTGAPSSSQAQPPSEAEQRLADFVSVVLADTEDTWNELFRQQGRSYREPTLVLFSGGVDSACGFAEAAVGPFYCPADYKVYIDLSFYDDLQRRFKAPGDFAQAYVIAHEVGHHVQNLLGISAQVATARRGADKVEANRLSVRQELQADCFSGVWAFHAHRARQVLESGDVEEALGAASAIGDDRLQQQSRGEVVPDSFTHGSSAQRVRWFKRGLSQGKFEDCDTFKAASL